MIEDLGPLLGGAVMVTGFLLAYGIWKGFKHEKESEHESQPVQESHKRIFWVGEETSLTSKKTPNLEL